MWKHMSVVSWKQNENILLVFVEMKMDTFRNALVSGWGLSKPFMTFVLTDRILHATYWCQLAALRSLKTSNMLNKMLLSVLGTACMFNKRIWKGFHCQLGNQTGFFQTYRWHLRSDNLADNWIEILTACLELQYWLTDIQAPPKRPSDETYELTASDLKHITQNSVMKL